MDKTLFLFLVLIFPLQSIAQSTLSGHVYDYENRKLPLPYVVVKNLNNAKETQTQSGGQFEIIAKKGDLLVFSKSGYHTDTLFLIDLSVKRIFLPVSVTDLKEVNIQGVRVNPGVLYRDPEAKEFKRFETDDLRGKKNNDRAGGLSFNLGYGKYRREQQKKQQIEETEIYEDEINANFTNEFVGKLTKLEGEELKNFIYLYKPSAGLVKADRPFNYTLYILKAFSTWQKLPVDQRKPPALPKIKKS
ncbi:peptidase associated/transthyretin-like domain-containing protein [Pedobacter sp. PWIIR3]